MNPETTAEIKTFLRRIHVYGLDPRQRDRIAEQLAEYGIEARHLRLVWTECQRNGEQAAGLMAKTIQDPANVVAIVDDIEQESAERHRRSTRPSSLAYVTDTNPYGWRNADGMRPLDHSRPGEWNTYRQCFNLTTEEAREFGRTDVRRHGCSRIEVTGYGSAQAVRKGQLKHPTPDWQPEAVQKAIPADTPEREVFGV